MISAVLWIVQALNEDTQRDLRCTVEITNVPDSLVRVSPIPEAFNVSVRSRGTDLIKYLWTYSSKVPIDYRVYKSGNTIHFGDAALKAFFRNRFGAGAVIQAVSPDSLDIAFTPKHGVKLPVNVEAKVSAAPQYIIVGRPTALTDSVTLYMVGGVSTKIKSLTTNPINLSDLRKTQIVKVPVSVPRNARAIPDSIDVRVEVEPLISKMRRVPIQPINVPAGERLVPVPSQIEVYYMVPMSIYKKLDSDPKFTVEADYNTIKDDNNDKLSVTLTHAPRDFTNVYLSVDSIDYIIEK